MDDGISSNLIDSTSNGDHVRLYEHSLFRNRINSLSIGQHSMPKRTSGPSQEFVNSLRNSPNVVTRRPSFVPVAAPSFPQWNDSNELDDDRYSHRSANMVPDAGINPVSILTVDDLNNLSRSGGRAVMQKVASADVVLFNKCLLYPRIPSTPQFNPQEKPVGCKTVLVNGFPSGVTQDVIREVFQLCGKISCIAVPQASSCYIRFSEEAAVENAVLLMGSHVQIDNDNGPPSTCKLRVFYARTRQDQCEHQQRLFQRELRIQFENGRHVRPSFVYTDREAASIITKLMRGESFSEPLYIVFSWLGGGKLIERNSEQFYTMFQAIRFYIRNLMNAKMRRTNSIDESRRIQMKVQEVLMRSNIVLVLFITAVDIGENYFTRKQKENINLWKMEVLNMLNIFLREMNFNRCNHFLQQTNESNPVVNVSDSDDEADGSITRVGNMLKHCEDLINKAQLDQNIYEITFLRRDSDLATKREHRQMQELVWSARDLCGRFQIVAESL